MIKGRVVRGGFLLLLMSSVTACEKPTPPESVVRPALVMTVSQAASQQSITVVGEVQPRYTSDQGFRVNGKIIKRYVEVGDSVKKGQLIARLDAVDANLNVKANSAAIEAADANVALATSELKRQQKLLEKHFISPAALERYQTAYDTAVARLAQVKAQKAVTQNQSSYTRLLADRDGIVNYINAEPGQVVNAGQVVTSIIATASLEVHIAVAEASIGQIKLKQAARVKLWSQKEEIYQAKVREIAPVADPVTGTYKVKLTLLKPDEKVKMGMTATVGFAMDHAENILIPSAAVIQKDGQTIVWALQDDEKVKALPVTVAAYHEKGAVIASGLTVGQKIVIAGAYALSENQRVTPVAR